MQHTFLLVSHLANLKMPAKCAEYSFLQTSLESAANYSPVNFSIF